jgi:hypothetical protein
MIKKFLKISLLVILLGFLSMGVADSSNRSKKDKEKNKEKAKVTSIYDKLFKEKSKLDTRKGAFTIHKYEDKVFLEMPLSLMSRDYLLSSYISKSSNPFLLGEEASSNRYITIDKTDSLIVFKEPSANVLCDKTDSNQVKAMKLSGGGSIIKTFPIKGYGKDSSSVIFEATDFFKFDSENVINLSGKEYVSIINISSAKVKSNASFLEGVDAFPGSVLIRNTSTAELSLSVIGFALEDKPVVSLSISTYLVLLPENKAKSRIANEDVGTGIIPFLDYRNIDDVNYKYYVTRRDLSKDGTLTFYVDPNIPDTWMKAITDAGEEWNKEFRNLDLGTPVKVARYPKDTLFKAEDPMVNTISFDNYKGQSINIFNITDPRDGQIFSTKISLSRDFAGYVRSRGAIPMAAVDARFRTFFIPDDLICEGLKAVSLTAFGYALGLSANLAGSYAYSPEQICSPKFTQENGFVGSIMDGCMYNILAQPGDKEKGVVLCVDKIGPADKFALKYLYKPIEGDEQKTLDKWVKELESHPEARYSTAMYTAMEDPRAKYSDLGNDPFKNAELVTNNIKFFAENAHKWYNDDKITDSYKESLLNGVFHEFYNNTLWPLFSYIGGIYLETPRAESNLKPFVSVPKDLQKKIVKEIISRCDDLNWLDANKEFLQFAGPNNNVRGWFYDNGYPIYSLMSRLRLMTLSTMHSDDPYTQSELLKDIENYIFKEVRNGQKMPQNKIILAETYLNGLVNASPAIKEIQKQNKGKKRQVTTAIDENYIKFLLADKRGNSYIHTNIEGAKNIRMRNDIYFYQSKDLSPECFMMLASARGLFLKAQRNGAGDEHYKDKISYYLNFIDKILE